MEKRTSKAPEHFDVYNKSEWSKVKRKKEKKKAKFSDVDACNNNSTLFHEQSVHEDTSAVESELDDRSSMRSNNNNVGDEISEQDSEEEEDALSLHTVDDMFDEEDALEKQLLEAKKKLKIEKLKRELQETNKQLKKIRNKDKSGTKEKH